MLSTANKIHLRRSTAGSSGVTCSRSRVLLGYPFHRQPVCCT